MEGDHEHEMNGNNFKNVKFCERVNIEETIQMGNQNPVDQIAQLISKSWQWISRKVMSSKHLNQQQFHEETVPGDPSIPEAIGQCPDAEIKKNEALKFEIQELKEEQERISSHPTTEISQPDSSIQDYDALADFKIKLEQMTEEKQKENQVQHVMLLEEKKLKHEQEMKEMWDNFNYAMNNQIRKNKEDFSQWSSYPD